LSIELNFQSVADDSSRSGDFLCFCLEISNERFQSFIAQNPTLSLDEIRVRSGVGSKCTACLLDSEVAYAEAVQNIVLRPGRGDDPGRSWLRLPKKADIYAALDRLAPPGSAPSHPMGHGQRPGWQRRIDDPAYRQRHQNRIG
jgi:bacterioferritin-associated ferredoxin